MQTEKFGGDKATLETTAQLQAQKITEICIFSEFTKILRLTILV